MGPAPSDRTKNDVFNWTSHLGTREEQISGPVVAGRIDPRTITLLLSPCGAQAMQILHIDCSPRPDGQSRIISAAIVTRLRALEPDAVIVRRDISALPMPDAPYAALLAHPDDVTPPAAQGSITLSETLIREIEAADILVLGTPVHNFTVPASLKSWLDHVVRVNRTVALSAQGKKGLLTDRPVLVGVAAGGIILGEDAQQPDFFAPYLRAVLGCIGLHDLHIVSVQGTAFCDASAKAAALKNALLTLSPVLSACTTSKSSREIPAPHV
ncbi:acyl carrier protein phosphodiesterase [Asaia bogorensis]|uniref:FMN dependent NADH:quinone oxidoreductase n=2 Tax=Acetobacteraceae TaxID=433 RepID=A0A060QLP5_9PROT|nr:acyl carrier protein phosphodiesterase [Asaia bogorensis]